MAPGTQLNENYQQAPVEIGNLPRKEFGMKVRANRHYPDALEETFTII